VYAMRRIQMSAPEDPAFADKEIGRFPTDMVFNMDQIPLLDEDKDGECFQPIETNKRHGADCERGMGSTGRTYDTLGSTDVPVKQANPSNSGTPRFGSIHLVIHSNPDVAQCPPTLIFKGTDASKLPCDETRQYAPGMSPLASALCAHSDGGT
jgi:hypothetical protein